MIKGEKTKERQKEEILEQTAPVGEVVYRAGHIILAYVI
jgi:hypothetical protein